MLKSRATRLRGKVERGRERRERSGERRSGTFSGHRGRRRREGIQCIFTQGMGGLLEDAGHARGIFCRGRGSSQDSDVQNAGQMRG